MTDVTETVHVTFHWTEAESIRDALRMSGRDEPVVVLASNLSFGPIDPPDADVRLAWIGAVLGITPSDDYGEEEVSWTESPWTESPWTEATASDIHPIYWVCLSDAAEHAAFLESTSRMAGKPFDVVDATGLDFVTAGGVRAPWSLGLLRPEDIVASGLEKRLRRFSSAEADAASAAWSKLRKENAPLRILRDGTLVSAPLTHFDDSIIEQASTQWEVAAKLIGRTFNHLAFDLDPPGQGPSDLVLFGRVLALGNAGGLELKGSGPRMRDYGVRRPAAP